MFAAPARAKGRGGQLDPGTLRALQAAKSTGKLSVRSVSLAFVPNEIWEFEERSFDPAKGGKSTEWWESERLARLHLENCDLLYFAPPHAEAPALFHGAALEAAPYQPRYDLIPVRLGALQALHVTHNERLHSFPLAAFRLPLLQDLDLSFNALEEFAAGEAECSLGDLQNDDIVAPLRSLSLHHNRLPSIASLRMLMLIDSPWASTLTKLLLHDNALTSLPVQLLNLSSLSVLSLARNRLAELPPRIGQKLSNLRELDVSENQLTSWPQSLVLMTRLERLNLRSNRMECADPSGLPAVPSSVKELFLGDNRMQHILGLQQCSNLATLDLSENSIHRLVVLGAQDLGASSFPTLALQKCWPMLQRLDVHNNNLAELPLELGLLEGLKAVQVQGNQLPVHLQDMPGIELVAWLQQRCHDHSEEKQAFTGERQGGGDFTVSEGKLDLSKSSLTEIPLGLLNNRTNAKHLALLRLSRNNIAEIPPAIGMLHSLTLLDLQKNRLASLPDELGKLEHLEDLDLSCNNFTAFPGNALFKLTRLKVVSLATNQLHQAKRLELGALAASGQSLLHLSLAENQLTSESIDFESIVAHMGALRHLDLGTNQLQSVPGILSQLEHLNVLDVQFNQLVMLPLELRQKTRPLDRRHAPLRLLAYGNLRPESSIMRLPQQ